jgi:hypothetical protein
MEPGGSFAVHCTIDRQQHNLDLIYHIPVTYIFDKGPEESLKAELVNRFGPKGRQ